MENEINKIFEIEQKSPTLREQKTINTTAKILGAIGKVGIVAGILVGLYIGLTLKISPDAYRMHPMRWVYGGLVMVSSFISGMFFIGIGEIIHQLTLLNINKKK